MGGRAWPRDPRTLSGSVWARISVRLGLAVAVALVLVLAGPPIASAQFCADTDIQWDGGGGNTSFHVAANWVGDTVPGAGQTACIEDQTPDITVVHSSAGGTQTIAVLKTEEEFTLASGILNITSATTTSQINATFNFTGGILGGAGTTDANNGIRISGFMMIISHTLNNAGTATWTGSNDIFLRDGATFNNTGTFDAQNDRGILPQGAAPYTFNNAGTFKKTQATGIT